MLNKVARNIEIRISIEKYLKEGILKPKEIADFLGCSLSTVYNERKDMKKREELEKERNKNAPMV